MHSAYFIMASQLGTGSGALATTSTDSEGQAHDKNTRSVWKSTLLTWPSELLECYRFEYKKAPPRQSRQHALLVVITGAKYCLNNSSNLLKKITSEKSGN